MAHVTFDLQWRESMMELLDQLEAEHPDEAALAPMEMSDYSCIYIKYVQIFRKLEEAYDQMAHPQKRTDMKKAVEAVLGRILEIKSWLVKLNKDVDSVNFDDILVDLKLTPDVLEIPLPRYFVEDRKAELEGRAKFLEALVEKYNVAMNWEEELKQPPPLDEEEAIKVLQVNERGRQGRERARLMRTLKKTQALEEKIALMGGSVSPEEAATRVQALVRGHLTRRRVRAITEAELVFIGMKPPAKDDTVDPVLREIENMQRRKAVQAENIAEYDRALVTLKQKVKEEEGQDMRELIQDRINEWFVENRDPATGDYPDLPDEEDGGSKEILNPPPPPPEEPEVDPKAAKDAKDAKVDAPPEEPKCPDYFVKLIHGAISDYQGDWQDIDESTNFFQKYDPELVKKALKPVVFEEIRIEVDEEMRVLLENLKDMVAAERAAKSGKKGKKGKGKKGKGKKGKGKKGKDKKGKKGKKDPTADRSLESLYAELVSNKIIQVTPGWKMGDYVGDFNYLGATLEKSGIYPDASMAQVRQVLTEYGVLPIGASEMVHQNIPTHTKAILLYGARRTGKTMLAQTVANAAGANFFNLSPRNTDGKYPGSQVKMLIHMVFKVARVMQPSVIYIDEIEKVFLSDKKKLKEYGSTELLNRIKKEFLKEVKSMSKGERVLIIGCSSEPYLCAKKDQKALMEFFQKHVHCPVPDYSSRRKLWPALVKRYGGGDLPHEFELSSLSHISEGYAPGTMANVVRTLLTKRRIEKLPRFPLTCREFLNVMAKFDKVGEEEAEELKDWTCKLPVRVKLDPEAAAAAEARAKAKGKKKK